VKLLGVHHVTAIATDPQRNLDFCTHVLGLRLVKRTVNFDDPGTYHLYFGDRTGRPGTIITFFPWPGARRGTRGTGQVVATSFAVPTQSIGYWNDRLKKEGVIAVEKFRRFDEESVRFIDPDGLMLELITSAHLDDVDLNFASAVPDEFAIRAFHAPTLEVQEAKPTEQLLAMFGFNLIATEGSRRRFALKDRSTSVRVDVVERSSGQFGNIAAGTVHHIAFRAANDEEQLHWRNQLVDLGLHVTPVIDRQYFHSIYFREPNGILFEIATDGPGFAIDEPVDQLGGSLKLPKLLEAERESIEQALPPIELHRPADR
jgi:glyoxalase family protein